MANLTRSWQAPPQSAPEHTRIGWIQEISEDGANWNQSQPGFKDWQRSIEILNGEEPAKDTEEYRTYLSERRLRTNVRTAVAGLANIRPIWGYHSIKEYETYAMQMNKTVRALYLQNHWGRDIKDAVWYAASTKTGWIQPKYRRGMAGMGKGKIELFTYGQPCVLPFQMPSSGDYQQAYAVTLMDEMPIFEAHSRWPLFQDQLLPTNSKYWYSMDIRNAATNNANKRQNAPHWWAKRDNGPEGSNLYVAIRYTTIIDPSINETGETVAMGQQGTPWYYEVPNYGSVIPDGIDEHGDPKTKVADQDDARIYPFRRLIISSEKCIMYDGPAFNWHGQLDLIPLSLDRMPWAPGGFSLVHDAYNIEKNLDKLQRGMMDRLRAQNNLALAYNLNAVTPQEAKAFDPLDPDNNRVGFDGTEVDKPFELPVPLEWYRITPEMLDFCQKLKDSIDYTMQMRDLVELGKSRVLGEDMDSLEQMLSALGPIVKDMGAEMECSLGMVGHQLKFLVYQYLTASEVMMFVGPGGMSPETMDYNPSDLYPSHLPHERPHGPNQEMVPSKYTKAQRSLFIAEKVQFVVMPNSIHQLHQMSTVLTYTQFKAKGMHISDYSIMSAADVPNLKQPDGNNEQEMWASEQKEEIYRQAEMAVIMKTVGMEEGLIPSPAAGPGGAIPTPGLPASGAVNGGGRPPTGQVTPHLEQKGDGRSTISES